MFIWPATVPSGGCPTTHHALPSDCARDLPSRLGFGVRHDPRTGRYPQGPEGLNHGPVVAVVAVVMMAVVVVVVRSICARNAARGLLGSTHTEGGWFTIPTSEMLSMSAPPEPASSGTVAFCAATWYSTMDRMRAAGHAGDLERVKHALATAQEPERTHISNTPAVRRNLPLCKERVAYYLEIAALELVVEEPSILQPLHVVTRAGRKPRLVLDLSRNLNDFVQAEHFKHSSIDDAVKLSTPGCYYGKMDVADCFLSFDVEEGSRKYLAFELDGVFYRFKRLCFGLCSAPWWCEQFMAVIDFALQERGVRHVRYCDDFLFVGATAADVRRSLGIAAQVLTEHGLRINDAKTEGPVQDIEFLGLGLTSVEQVVYLPSSKASELHSIIGTMAGAARATKRQLQSLVGKFSFAAAVLPGARPFFRSLIDATKGVSGAFQSVALTPSMHADLAMWRRFLGEWSGRSKWRRADASAVLHHDASKSGFGFFLSNYSGDVARLPERLRPGSAFAGFFSEDELRGPVAHSIQWAELFSIAFSMTLYAPYLRDSAVTAFTDNIADVHIINRQSTKQPSLLVLLQVIYRMCAEYNIDIRAVHVAGEENVVADHLSRPQLHKHQARVPHHLHASPLTTQFIHSSSLCLDGIPAISWKDL